MPEVTHTLQFNPYEMATLGEMDSGHLKGGRPLHRSKNNRKAVIETLITGRLLGLIGVAVYMVGDFNNRGSTAVNLSLP